MHMANLVVVGAGGQRVCPMQKAALMSTQLASSMQLAWQTRFSVHSRALLGVVTVCVVTHAAIS